LVNRKKRTKGIQTQRSCYEAIFSKAKKSWEFHDTPDPLTRYVRDRRLGVALEGWKKAAKARGESLEGLSVLCVCGGVGGEASFLKNQGLNLKVTNSDFSPNALKICKARDPEIPCLELNAEDMDLEDNSFDLVLVQDGLHHLPRPVLGLNEMVRIARRGVAVIEPQRGFLNRWATTWERQEEGGQKAVNYVFRWDKGLFEALIQSQLGNPENPPHFECARVWDHPTKMDQVTKKLPKGMQRPTAQLLYGALGLWPCPWSRLGNSFVGTALWSKDSQSQ
jgi:SAM-dependent methyltransferase